MDKLPITDSRDYAESLSKILKDIRLWCAVSKRKTWVKIPDKLLARLAVDDSPDLAYERIKVAISRTVENYCKVVEWDRGEDADGQYIKFSILPERIMDET